MFLPVLIGILGLSFTTLSVSSTLLASSMAMWRSGIFSAVRVALSAWWILTDPP
jgi:hypothetical protein